MKWDPFIESASVLEKSSSGRLQVVRTRYKELANLQAREFVDKKIFFCLKQDANNEYGRDTPSFRMRENSHEGFARLRKN